MKAMVFSHKEVVALRGVLEVFLGDYNDDYRHKEDFESEEEWVDFRINYQEVARLYYVMTGKDFLGNQNYVTKDGVPLNE